VTSSITASAPGFARGIGERRGSDRDHPTGRSEQLERAPLGLTGARPPDQLAHDLVDQRVGGPHPEEVLGGCVAVKVTGAGGHHDPEAGAVERRDEPLTPTLRCRVLQRRQLHGALEPVQRGAQMRSRRVSRRGR
jgi:hypothetical protein